jgi:predicted O-methyltransferase YrrM
MQAALVFLALSGYLISCVHVNRAPKSVKQCIEQSLNSNMARICLPLIASTTIAHKALAEDKNDAAFIRAKYPYAAPKDFLTYLYDVVDRYESQESKYEKVINAMDEFSDVYPMYKLSPEKSAFLQSQVKKNKARNILEIGTFFGYSALKMAHVMSTESQLCAIEGDERNLETTKAVIELVYGNNEQVMNRIHFIYGLSSDVITNPGFPQPSITTNGFDFVFLDHDKTYLKKDLILLEKKGLLNVDKCIVVADNVIFPGAPDYLEYVNYSSPRPSADNFRVSAPRWQTNLTKFAFERKGFETQYKEVDDAMSVSIRTQSG